MIPQINNKLKIGAPLLALFPLSLSAATIAWSPSVDLFAGGDVDTFISNNGTSVVAVNGVDLGGSGTTIAGGVTFTNADEPTINTGITANGVTISSTTSDDNGTSFGSGALTDPGVIALIQGGFFASPATAPEFTFTGLTSGQTYEIQIFVNDARTNGGRGTNWEVGFTDGTGSTVAAIADLNNLPDGNASGDYIIGTFVADATGSQSFQYAGTRSGHTLGTDINTANVNGGQAQINAIQLRAIPEPSSTLLIGLGSLAFIARRRRS